MELRGLLDHASVIDLMQTACVVAVPSIVPDCCPTVILEAMALGRPVVAAASGGIVDLVDDGVTGLLVAPDDPDTLSAALSAVVDDRDAAAAMGREALKRAPLFTASAVVGRIESLYERLHRRPVAGEFASRLGSVGLDAYFGFDLTAKAGIDGGGRR